MIRLLKKQWIGKDEKVNGRVLMNVIIFEFVQEECKNYQVMVAVFWDWNLDPPAKYEAEC
jgi:hypothetical protein